MFNEKLLIIFKMLLTCSSVVYPNEYPSNEFYKVYSQYLSSVYSNITSANISVSCKNALTGYDFLESKCKYNHLNSFLQTPNAMQQFCCKCVCIYDVINKSVSSTPCRYTSFIIFC